MTTPQEWLNAGLLTLSGVTGWYALYMKRKSKKTIQNEEEGIFIDNADKFTSIWERIAAPMQEQLNKVEEKYNDMLGRYTELKIEFEVNKQTSDFLLNQANLKLEVSEGKVVKLEKENKDLRDQIGTGRVRNLNS